MILVRVRKNSTSKCMLFMFCVISGLRSLKIVLQESASRLLMQPSDTEENLLYQALLDINIPKINPKDVQMFKSIIDDLFPRVTTEQKDFDWLKCTYEQKCTEKCYQPSQLQHKKLIEMYQMSKCRQGIILVGNTYVGKSFLLKTLTDAIVTQHKSEDNVMDIGMFSNLTKECVYFNYPFEISLQSL